MKGKSSQIKVKTQKKVTVTCPICSDNFSYFESENRPFCSDKCKQIDLGHWFLEGYRVPSKEPLSDTDIEACLMAEQNDLEKE